MIGTDHEKLYEACYMQVYSYVMTLCRDGHLAEEITQETFFKAMKAGNNASFGERSKELTWLCAIAKNVFNDELRRRKRQGELPAEMESTEDVEKAVSDEDMSFRIHVAVHALPEPYKEVFQLRVFGELSFLRIGELFGKSENWARVTYHRARLKIKEGMDTDG